MVAPISEKIKVGKKHGVYSVAERESQWREQGEAIRSKEVRTHKDPNEK